MDQIWTPKGCYRLAEYENETDFESAINLVKDELFGRDRIYLDVKRRIGRSGPLRNIPDGYLIDLSSRKPQLYVVENELARHDPLRHIAVQILQFSLSFETDQHTIKKILLDSVQGEPDAISKCQKYAQRHGYRNLDHLLEFLVYEAPFAALVVIDAIPENLENVLVEKFRFGVDVLELARFVNDQGEHIYEFSPLLADLAQDTGISATEPIDRSEIDTVVVPARKDGFEEVFLAENRWYEIRLHGTMRPQIKHIAVYQVAPFSAITHIAPVASIEPWKDSGKFVVNFAEPARKIGPVKLIKKGKVKALQNLRYTTRERLLSAKTLDEVW